MKYINLFLSFKKKKKKKKEKYVSNIVNFRFLSNIKKYIYIYIFQLIKNKFIIFNYLIIIN